MTSKVFRGHVLESMRALAKTAEALGLKSSEDVWDIIPGSVLYEKPWMLLCTRNGRPVPVHCPPGGVLGETGREAILTLNGINEGYRHMAERIRNGTIRL